MSALQHQKQYYKRKKEETNNEAQNSKRRGVPARNGHFGLPHISHVIPSLCAPEALFSSHILCFSVFAGRLLQVLEFNSIFVGADRSAEARLWADAGGMLNFLEA